MCTDGVQALQLASHGVLPVQGRTKQLDYTRVFWSNAYKKEQDYFQLFFFFSEILYFKGFFGLFVLAKVFMDCMCSKKTHDIFK